MQMIGFIIEGLVSEYDKRYGVCRGQLELMDPFEAKFWRTLDLAGEQHTGVRVLPDEGWGGRPKYVCKDVSRFLHWIEKYEFILAGLIAYRMNPSCAHEDTREG